MKNSVSKLVIGMLITSFVMPEMVMASRVKGRRRSAGTASNRAASTGSGTATAITGLGTTGAMAVSAEQKDIVISKDEYKLPENKVKYINTLSTNVYQAKEKALQQCNGISGAVSKIFALSTTSAVASGLGTAAAGTALVSGIIKSNKQNVAYALQEHGVKTEEEKIAMEKLDEKQKQKLVEYEKQHDDAFNVLKEKAERYNELVNKKDRTEAEEAEFKDLTSKVVEEDGEYQKKLKTASTELNNYRQIVGLPKLGEGGVINASQDEIDKNLKTATTLGHVRTGMMAGATATSAISMGTSIGATIDAGKLAEKMDNCNKAIAELNKANGLLKAEIANAKEVLEQKLGDEYEEKKPSYMKEKESMNATIAGIVAGCKKFETKDIKYVENLMTASSVISGIGTATALTGAITSGFANSKKAKGDRKYEKNLDITANVMAGITTGTSLTSTGLSSAAAVATGKKLQNQAKECENALANNLLADVSKEVNAITKSQQERDAERQANIEKLRKEGKI